MPILFLAIYYINFYNKNTSSPIKIIKNTHKDSQIQSVQYFENLLKKYNIENPNIDLNNKIITISINSKFNKILSFLNESENKYKIISYNMYKNDKLISLLISFNTNQNIIKTISNIKYKYKNPFKKISKKRIKNSKAIIGDFVMINSKWYKLNDKYKKYKIIKINKTSIILSNTNKTFEMELF